MESKKRRTSFEYLFGCFHKWKFIRKERGRYKGIDVCECIKCGQRRGFDIW